MLGKRNNKRRNVVLVLLLVLCGCGSNRNEQANHSSNTRNTSIALDTQALYNRLLLGPELKKAIADQFDNQEIKGIGLVWHRENLYVVAVDQVQSRDNAETHHAVYFAASVLTDNDNKPYWDVQLIALHAKEVIRLIGSFDKSTNENSND